MSHETEPLYLWLQGIYGYMDLFLSRLRFILCVVLCGVRRDGRSFLSHLKGTFCLLIEEKRRARLAAVSVGGEKTAIFHLKINQTLCAKKVYCDSILLRGINSLFDVPSVLQWKNRVSSHSRRPTEESQHLREEAE